MEKLKEAWEGIDISVRKALCIALSLIIVFSSGHFIGSLTNINQTVAGAQTAEAQAAPAATQQAAQAVATTVGTTAAATTAAPAQQTTASGQADASTGAPQTTEEIVALFNEASNKVKTEATKVVKNFEMRNYDEAASVIPSALSSLAAKLMDQYLGDDTTPIEFATKDDIIANYQVPEQTYSSQLTAADVATATCTDNGTEYEITLNLNQSVNPTAGVGVGAACDVIESEQVSSNGAVAAILKEFTITYSDCVIKCKIDKATKRVTWSNYLTPLVIDATASVVVATVDAKVVLSFEKDYTITY